MLRDMPCVRGLKERLYIARLSTLVVSLKGVTGFSNQMDVYTVLRRLFDVLPSLENLESRDPIAIVNLDCRQRFVTCSPIDSTLFFCSFFV